MSRKDYAGKHRDPDNRRAKRTQTKCPSCDGAGQIADYQNNTLRKCPSCYGTGIVRN